MKTTVKMLAFPLIGFAMASAGAVSSNTAKTSRTAKPPLTAFIHTTSNPCQEVQVACNPNGGSACLYNNGPRAWDKVDEDSPCNEILYKD